MFLGMQDFTFSYRQHRVFIARSKLWSTSQRHTVLKSTATSLFLVSIAGTTGMKIYQFSDKFWSKQQGRIKKIVSPTKIRHF